MYILGPSPFSDESICAGQSTSAGPPTHIPSTSVGQPTHTSVPLPSTSTWQPSAPLKTPLRMPVFSEYVKARLRAGDSHEVWKSVVTESAYFYILNYPEIGANNSSIDYRVIGQAVYKAFPSIAREGTQPWVRT